MTMFETFGDAADAVLPGSSTVSDPTINSPADPAAAAVNNPPLATGTEPLNPDPNANPSQLSPGADDKTKLPEPDDYSTSPFTEYGEFNQSHDEESDALFFQFGRFFGLSLGLGIQAVDGNRGLLWQGGFPLVDFKVHYWFDLNLALNMSFYTVNHFFVTGSGQTNVSMFKAGLDLKYYFNTKNLSAAISFASPYILGGVGSYNKAEYAPTVGSAPTSLSSVGVALGGGLEFTLFPKKTYLEVEGKFNYVPFYDSGSSIYAAAGIPNLNGNFWTVTTSLLLTW